MKATSQGTIDDLNESVLSLHLLLQPIVCLVATWHQHEKINFGPFMVFSLDSRQIKYVSTSYDCVALRSFYNQCSVKVILV